MFVIDQVIDANLRGVLSRPYVVWAAKERECANIYIKDLGEIELKSLYFQLGRMYDFSVYWRRLFKLRPLKNDTLYCFEVLEKIYKIERQTDGKYYEQYITEKYKTGTK